MQSETSINKKQLKNLKFHLTHQIIIRNKRLEIKKISKSNSAEPTVYLWIRRAESKLSVLYVGKAGKGIDKRLREHLSGFSSSQSGIRKSNYIKSILAEPNDILVFTRTSTEIAIFGTSVSMFSTEEQALGKIFSPPLNFATFR